jgi:HAD superfamily hydrolase (TIGR01549 family)
MIKAIIFDLDGTLVGVEKEFRRNLIRKVLDDFNKKVPGHELDELWFMHSRSEMVKKWGIDVDVFWDAFKKNDSVKTRIKHTYVYDDIDYLNSLKEKGIKLALLTGARHEIAHAEVDLLNRSVFEFVLIADPNGDVPSKPHPLGVEKCLEKLGIDKKNAIYVGNSDEDLLTAKNAGMFLVLIDRNEHKHDLLPDMKITTLNELDKIIKK